MGAQRGGCRNKERGHKGCRITNASEETYWELLSETNPSLGRLRCASPAGTGKFATRRARLGAKFPETFKLLFPESSFLRISRCLCWKPGYLPRITVNTWQGAASWHRRSAVEGGAAVHLPEWQF